MGSHSALQVLRVNRKKRKRLKDCTCMGTKGDVTEGKSFVKAKFTMKNFQNIK